MLMTRIFPLSLSLILALGLCACQQQPLSVKLPQNVSRQALLPPDALNPAPKPCFGAQAALPPDLQNPHKPTSPVTGKPCPCSPRPFGTEAALPPDLNKPGKPHC